MLKLIAYFSATIKCTTFAIYFDTLGGPRYAIPESICIIYVDVESICIVYVYIDYYANILDYLLGVPSIAQINRIFFCNN